MSTERTEWTIRFWRDENGVEPARLFLEGLKRRQDRAKRFAAYTAIERILRVQGTDICGRESGKNLGKTLYEFRIRHSAEEIERLFAAREEESDVPQPGRASRVLLRLFFTTSGDQVLFLLSGYDKGAAPSSKREQEEISKARRLVARARCGAALS